MHKRGIADQFSEIFRGGRRQYHFDGMLGKDAKDLPDNGGDESAVIDSTHHNQDGVLAIPLRSGPKLRTDNCPSGSTQRRDIRIIFCMTPQRGHNDHRRI